MSDGYSSIVRDNGGRIAIRVRPSGNEDAFTIPAKGSFIDLDNRRIHRRGSRVDLSEGKPWSSSQSWDPVDNILRRWRDAKAALPKVELPGAHHPMPNALRDRTRWAGRAIAPN